MSAEAFRPVRDYFPKILVQSGNTVCGGMPFEVQLWFLILCFFPLRVSRGLYTPGWKDEAGLEPDGVLLDPSLSGSLGLG